MREHMCKGRLVYRRLALAHLAAEIDDPHVARPSQDRLGTRINAVLDRPLNVADPDRHARQLCGERIDLDSVQNLGADAQGRTGEAEQLAIIDRAIFEVLHALQSEIEKIARAAGGVQYAQPGEALDEIVAQPRRLGPRRGELLLRVLAGLARGLQRRRHQRLDARPRRVPFAAQRAQPPARRSS
jgi:hypothetical protein